MTLHEFLRENLKNIENIPEIKDIDRQNLLTVMTEVKDNKNLQLETSESSQNFVNLIIEGDYFGILKESLKVDKLPTVFHNNLEYELYFVKSKNLNHPHLYWLAMRLI